MTDEAWIKVVTLELRIAPEVLRGLLELREMVHVMLNQIADLFRRNMRQIEPGLPLTLEEACREGLRRFFRSMVRAIKREQSSPDGWTRGGELANLGGEDVLAFEERVGERFEEPRGQAAVFIIGKRMQLDAE